MDDNLRVFLICYLGLYIFCVVLLRAFLTSSKINKSPVLLDLQDDIRGIVTKGLLFTYFLLIINIVFFCLFNNYYFYLVPIVYFDNNIIKYIGTVLLIISLILIIIAQYQMGESWRMGIDDNTSTKLVNRGIYKLSRNPIYTGIMLTQMGLFLVTSNAVTLLSLVLSFVLFQIQIRLEEEYLLKHHGKDFVYYINSTKRWI